MDNKKIKISCFNDIESLKIFILQQLKLVDYKKNCVAEFEERLKNYIERNKSVTILFQIDREKLEENIKLYLSLSDQPFPDNFEMGNSYNRWYFDSRPKTNDEINKEAIVLHTKLHDKLLEIKDFIDKLEKTGNGRIYSNTI